MNVPRTSSPFDFDQWATLARQDPEAFERMRGHTIEQAICQAPAGKRQRLRRLQWQLDRIRQTSRTPMVACLRMNRLLWKAVIGEGGLLDRLGRSPSPADPHPPRHSARILPFRGQPARKPTF